jgi:hypothetical protein
MDFIKDRIEGLKSIGFGAAVPGLRDKLFNAVDNVTSNNNKAQDEKIKALEAEVAAGKKTQQQAAIEARSTGMKKGGKVSSASKRADGIAIKGKTKGRIV